MLAKSLLAELRHEGENTRRLFDAIPDEVLSYRPNDFNWSIAQLASHIAEVYHWWDDTLNTSEFKLETYRYDKGDITRMAAIKAKLDHNLDNALAALDGYPDEKMMEMWSMTQNGQVLMPAMPRAQVVRGFLMNHLYHHRGQLTALLRVNNVKIPGLYGPTYEDMEARKAAG